MSTHSAPFLINTAHAANEAGDFATATWWAQQAINVAPELPEGWYNYARSLAGQGKRADAIDALAKAEQKALDSALAQNSIGLLFAELEAETDAERCLQRAIVLAPGQPLAYSNLGRLRIRQKRFEEAEAAFRTALELSPALAAVHANLGLVLCASNKLDEALHFCLKATELAPSLAQAWCNLAEVFMQRRNAQGAELAARKAIELNPKMADAWGHLGRAHLLSRQLDAAETALSQSLELNPGADYLHGYLAHTRMQMCEWRFFESDLELIRKKILAGEKASPPFDVLSLVPEASIQRRCAEIYAADIYPEQKVMGSAPPGTSKKKIKVAYFSADFREHPVAYLMAEVFELHDKSRFETIAFSYGAATADAMADRVARAFDRFIDVSAMSSREVAQLAREMRVDIAVDLGGYTEGGRPGPFAYRAAPVQLGYLGYLGSMGASYFDYLIADRFIIPEPLQSHYSEKVIYLPNYQANDSKRDISSRIFSREELGLPATGVVFCCFNSSYKISPATFNSWMRILRQVEGSVLLIYAENKFMVENLRLECAARGVTDRRLVFAGKLPRPEYLARYRVADLFLDTLVYNAGTTASDALWAGLPVLTCAGEAFASRVGSSLLHAVGLPELVTSTIKEYESRAVDLAMNPEQLARLKQKLKLHRLSAPLFDTPLHTRSLELAYQAIHERALAGHPPEHVHVDQRVNFT